MNLYLIRRNDNEKFGYDEYDAHVIAADNESDVRRTAAKNPADEGEGAWFDDRRSTVELIGHAADGIAAGTVLSSYNAG